MGQSTGAQERSLHFSRLASGLRSAEGPVVLPGGDILCCEVMGGALTRVTADGVAAVVAVVGGGPNGAALGPKGLCYVCNNGGLSPDDIDRLARGVPSKIDARSAGSIQVVDLSTGETTTLYDRCEDVCFAAPNDLVFDVHGGFYFTDYGNLRSPAPEPGAVFYAKADGSGVRRLIPNLERPNGIGLSPDGCWVLVAETYAGRLSRYPVRGPGDVASSRGETLFEDSAFKMDSLAVQADGKTCVACPPNNLILRISPDGCVEHINTPPGWPSNICFGGEENRFAYVTSVVSGELWQVKWDAPGLPLAYSPVAVR